MAENRIIHLDDREPVPSPAGKSVSILSPQGLVSILIPCCGQLEYTKLCVPSVLRHSRKPFEIIFLDIGSLDGTAEYLAGVKAAAQVRVEIVRAATDLDLGKAVKEALALAHGEYLALLNNDTVVTNAWLNMLIGLVSSNAAIGMAGPMSNYAAPPQLVEKVPYRAGPRRKVRSGGAARSDNLLLDTLAVEDFACSFREEHRAKWMEVERLGGFCLLFRRQVSQKIEQFGSLDKWTDLSLFDTDNLSAKAREAGFMLACCRDLFVHHFGTRTFAHGAPKEVTAPR
jgi:GT2 family glycosyltransferase